MGRLEFLVVIDFDSVQKQRGASAFGFFAAGIKARCAKNDVEVLPCQWRQGGSDFRFTGGRQAIVEPAVGRAVEPSVSLVDIGFIAGLDEDPAIARQAKRPELNMQMAVPKL